ncbi:MULTISPECIES: DOMON-like domain-containing protein [unclassified Novosphingobium]|uniref:DOMON-like domain-containing protein n=1 Tax=unclassified Novosphingobium TaxID=2644732 RepID=UPI0025EAE548|nr:MULTISPECIES: DOMON-like domain-containing protein [unclassified Novosphingobium]HQV02775.1 DOMON-like domain-containing protein [Novosphingobium sp.]
METYWLTCHPDTPGKAIKAISAKVSHASADNIGLWFDLHGETAQLVWPQWALPRRADNLWQSTCFEMFIADGAGPGYREFNFSPGGAWAGYGFDSYREGMRDLDFDRVPEVYEATRTPECCSLHARIVALAKREARISLSAVIEERNGTKSYWALAHPPGKPDFHHPTCFAATLPPPSTA